jgi:hypothetical protein
MAMKGGGTPAVRTSGREIPDPQVKDAADQYDEARRVLEALGPFSGVVLPLLNNSIVAVELYLKSLNAERIYLPSPYPNWLEVRAKPQRGHELEVLLDAIPKEYREPLEREFRERFSAELRGTLCSYEQLFQESRYPYKEDVNISSYPLAPLMKLCEFLCEYIQHIEPRFSE